jgi:carboxylate-amine ligase
MVKIAPQRSRAAWARWCGGRGRRYTVGIEEEAMILDAARLQLAPCSEQLLARMGGRLRDHAGLETHASVMELKTGVHQLVPKAVRELADLRRGLAETVGGMGLRCACAGTYPLANRDGVMLSTTPRYSMIARSMRGLVHRAPTMALHVHVGVGDPDDAVRVLNALRPTVPLLLALSANSPFCEGRDGGFASERTTIFGAFPRTGTPRAFADFEQYVQAVDTLLGSGALPNPTFLWWDLRLQPRLGTVEVRVMDAQIDLADTAAIAALVQSLSRMALEEDLPWPEITPEALAENRFLAARDGMDARLIDCASGRLQPVGAMVDALIERCHPHAQLLGCAKELELVHGLAGAGGAARQRRQLGVHGALTGVLEMLVEGFAPALRSPGARSDGLRAPAWLASPAQTQVA